MDWLESRIGPLLSQVRLRLRALFRRSDMERELDEELRFHVEMEAEKRVREGLDAREARRRALVAFGGVEHHKEHTRSAWGVRWVEDAAKDVRYAGRQLRKRPGFTALAVVTLALGIGANTAIFSVVKTVLLDPLPYPDADELVTIHNRATNREWGVHPWTQNEIFLEMERSDSFEEVAGYYPRSFAVTGEGRPFQLEGAQVTPDLFRLFQASVALGRDFVEADAHADAPRTAIISHDVWQRRFGGSPDVIGRSIDVASTEGGSDEGSREIIGVLAAGFRLFAPRVEDPGLWIPFEAERVAITVARLRDGVSLRRAQSELDVASARLGERYRDRADPGWTPLKSEIVRDDRATLLMLQVAVGLVLLIACVNVANLLLARHGARQAEVAIRSALGAGRGRLLRQALTESVMLSVLGGVAALLVMAFGLKLLLALAPADVPRIAEVSVDGSVLLFTLAIAVAVGLLAGAAPAVAAGRRAPGNILEEGGRTSGPSRRQRRFGRALVIGEVAMVLVLLVGAGVLGRSFVSLTRQDPGFRTEGIVTVSMETPRDRYRSVPEWIDFQRRVLERVRGIPGAESVALGRNVPLDRGSIASYRVEGDPESATGDAQFDVVSADYFRTLDIPLVSGRYFDETDRAGTTPVAVIDEAMARAAWPGQDPVGRRLRLSAEGEWLTVVGVVGDIRGSGLAHEPRPGLYIPYRQRVELDIYRRTVLLVRSPAGLEALAEPLRQAVWDVDPRQPVPAITTLERIASASVGPHRFRALLLGSFGAIALMLAVAGIYGVVEQLVTQRRHEFGVRMALGAGDRDILRMVVRRGAALAGVGVAMGLLAAIGVARFLTTVVPGAGAPARSESLMPQPWSILHGVTPTDPPTLAAVAALLGGVALLASYIPARRAAKVDPMVTLNAE